MFSALFIIAGLYVYYANFGWVFPPTLSMGFLASAALILVGLFLIFHRQKMRI